MEPSKEAIAVRLTRLNRQILGKVTNSFSYSKKVIDREALLDALTVLYDECNEDCVKKGDELIRGFLDKYRSALADLRRTRVCLSDFDMLHMIGRGHFGDVHMVREKHTGDVYALKSLRKETALTRKGVACYEEERDVLAMGAAPWLVKLQYAFQDHNSLYLVMELCSGGDLAGLLARRGQPMCERDAAFYVAEVTHALKALHNLGYVHRDVKPQNILLDRCGHVKLCDFGSSCRLSEGCSNGVSAVVGTPDYVSPELLSAAVCSHTVCLQFCRKMLATAISACDYWSLGVVAFEMVTLKKPFTEGDDDTLAHTLARIQKYEREEIPTPPFDPLPSGPSEEWRSLVAGLLRVQPSKRFHYLDTLQHPALKHLSPHSIRDQVPPWVPCVRGSEDSSYFTKVPREPSQPDAMPFRTRAPFAGQLPFIGFSYVAQEDTEEHSMGFSASHDCTAIDLATYKSAEKLASLRGRELARLQEKLAAAEATAETATAELKVVTEQNALHAQDARLELQKEILNLGNSKRRLEKELQLKREECRQIEKSYNELLSSIKERTSSDLKAAFAKNQELETEKNSLREECRTLESRVKELTAEADRASFAADNAKKQEEHYKDTIAKERALRRQTLTGGQIEVRDAVAKISLAESNAMRASQAKAEAERKIAELEHINITLKAEMEAVKTQLQKIQDTTVNKQRNNDELQQQIKDLQLQLTQEKCKSTTFSVQVKELQATIEEMKTREVELEEQRNRTDARFTQQVEAAEARAAEALNSDSRHRQKVTTLEQLVKQLEREVRALEAVQNERRRDEIVSDTESVTETESVVKATTQAQITLLKEQLDKSEKQLQARSEEIATLKQEARTANLARWRKEREVTDLQTDLKSTQREVKRLEERLATASESRRNAEQKVVKLQNELETIKPELDSVKKELEEVKERLKIVAKTNDTYEAEVDRSRNDIRKLKSELQYSEKRRIHAETQEELASRERAVLRDEAQELRVQNNALVQNNKALQEACSLLEEQLTDLEKLADLNEVRNRDLESELSRLRTEVSECRKRLSEAESSAVENKSDAVLFKKQLEDAKEAAEVARAQIELLKERLERNDLRISELEDELAESMNAQARAESALKGTTSRLRSIQEESSSLRTRTHEQHSTILQLQAQLADAQEEISAAKEAADAASAWWRTRETKMDATLRQQTKLIDFLQAKVEEANRKKCSLGNKLFGKSKRSATSPPLRRANRELQQQVDRLRSRLSAADASYQPTPKKERPTPKPINGKLSIDTPDCRSDNTISLILSWNDGRRERVAIQVENGALTFILDGTNIQASLVNNHPVAENLTKDEANRSFAIKTNDSKAQQLSAICDSEEVRARLLQQLLRPLGYVPNNLVTVPTQPSAALCLAEDSFAIGCSDGLHSLHGPVHLEFEDGSEAGYTGVTATSFLTSSARIFFIRDGMLLHTSQVMLSSALKRASCLNPVVKVHRVNMPDTGSVTMVQEVTGEPSEYACAAAACGRRVFLMRYEASNTDFKVIRSLTVDRAPNSILLTRTHLYIAGERPLRITLPSGALESFATDDPTISAAAKRHSQPKAILLIKENPTEILICYNECGVFVDENGKRTRSEDAKWTTAVQDWVYVDPFLYCVSKDDICISYINEEAYKLPPCTCDNHSVASTNSECAAPRSHTIAVKEPRLLGATPKGVLISSPFFSDYHVLFIDGLAALRSIGASVESLDSVWSDVRESDVVSQNSCSL